MYEVVKQCYENIYICLNGNGFFLEIVKYFDHMFIDYLDSVNHLSIICDDLKKFTWFCTAGYLCLIGALAKFAPERVKHEFGQGT